MQSAETIADELRTVGLNAGLAAVGFTTAEPLDRAYKALTERKAEGLHGGMQFTYRNPERSTTPRRIMAEANTLIVGALGYPAPEPVPHIAMPTRRGRPHVEIAAYAWRDHYAALRDALGAMGDVLTANGYKARVVADDNALVDRAAAVRAGIGWSGKNSNVLLPGHGSWFVLGAVVTDLHVPPSAPVVNACGSCTRCQDHCPTDAIIADGVVDARRCLAWLLQATGDFPVEFRHALGTRIYGCDDCQVVCPPSRGHNVALVGDEVRSLDLLELLEADEATLLSDVGRWYIPKRDVRYVRRNALVALGNSAIESELRGEVQRVLQSFVGSDDMLERHARWAAEQLGIALQ